MLDVTDMALSSSYDRSLGPEPRGPSLAPGGMLSPPPLPVPAAPEDPDPDPEPEPWPATRVGCSGGGRWLLKLESSSLRGSDRLGGVAAGSRHSQSVASLDLMNVKG